MDQSKKPTKLENRVTSSFPLSIGTALALETLFDPREKPYDETREIPQRIDLSNYSDVWINLSTLYRNMMTSMDQVSFLAYNPETIADFILSEIGVIESLFAVEGQNLCLPRFYVNSYFDFFESKKYEQISKRIDKTDLQKRAAELYKKSVRILMKVSDSLYEFKDKLKPKGKPKALIITHMAYDLLSKSNFSDLSLLESHTGQIKAHYQWNSKFYQGPSEIELSNKPFMKKTLFIFGDRHLIRPMDIRIRREINDISKQRNWTPFTTEDKVNYDLELIKEHYVRHLLQSF